MIKEAINRILDLAMPNLLEINGRQYCDKPMNRIPEELTACPLEVHTLTSLIDYISRGTDDCALLDCDDQAGDIHSRERRYIVHVESHKRVLLYLELNGDKARECLLDASIEPISFPFGKFLPVEDFIVAMQSHFVPSENVDALVKLVGTVTDDNTVKLADDGITQRVETKSGIGLVGLSTVPNPISLAPYRTFHEIEQPESSFVFRVKKDGMGGITAALFTADGNAWRNDAILAVHQYFEDMIPEDMREEVIILA